MRTWRVFLKYVPVVLFSPNVNEWDANQRNQQCSV